MDSSSATCGTYVPPSLMTGDANVIMKDIVVEATKYAADEEMHKYVRFAGFESAEAARTRRQRMERINSIKLMVTTTIAGAASYVCVLTMNGHLRKSHTALSNCSVYGIWRHGSVFYTAQLSGFPSLAYRFSIHGIST